MSRLTLSIFLAGALALGCTPAATSAPSAGATEATLALLRKAEPSVAELKSAVAAVVHAKAPSLVAAAPVVTVEDAAVLTLEKVREDVSSPSAVPKKGDTARIDYAFSYLEAQGTTEIAMDGTLAVGFAFDGANFNPVDRPQVDESHFGITDVMTGNVTDCDTGLPLYKAEVTVFFRDDMVKRLFTGQAGEYTIRAVKGEQVTVRASYPNYTAEDVYTYVPDQVDFTLCAAPQPPAPGPGTGSTEPPPAGLLATDLATGVFHTCAVTSDKEVRCWGKNDEGQLGNGTLVSSAMPVTVSSLADVAQVEAGDRHTCALTTGGGREVLGQKQLGATWQWNLHAQRYAGAGLGSDLGRARHRYRRKLYVRRKARRR